MKPELIEKAQHLLNKAKIRLMQDKNYTFYIAILFQLKIDWTDKVPMAAVNEETLFLNPIYWVDRYTEGHLHDILHEIMHLVLMHTVRILRYKGANKDKYNYAADISINNMLKEIGCDLDNTFVMEPKYKGKSTEEIYNLIPNPPPKYKPDIQVNTGSGKSPQAQEEKIKELLSNAKVQAESSNGWGAVHSEIKRHIINLLEPKLDWKTLLANYASEIKKEDYSWSRPSRRSQDIYLPGLYSEAFGEISAYIDCSGSIGQRQYTEFLSEIQSVMTTLNPNITRIINWGTRLDKEVKIYPGDFILDKANLTNMGGTNIGPVMNHIKKIKPEISIILTDGAFSDSNIKPDTDIIWVIVGNKNFKAPVGKIIHYA